MAHFLLSSRLLSIHPVRSRLTHYFDAYTIGLVSCWKMEPEYQFQGQKMGIFLNRFTGKNQFLFHELKLLYHGIQYPKITPIHVGKHVNS